MPRKRDGFVPLGDVAEAVEFPSDRALTHSIYIFIIKTDGVIFFHGASMDLEGVSLWDREDKNGVLYTQDLIRAAEAGGGFVDYLFDNPDVMGDEEDGSPKVGYAELLTFEDDTLIIGSGFYPATPVPLAPPLAYVLLRQA